MIWVWGEGVAAGVWSMGFGVWDSECRIWGSGVGPCRRRR